MQEIIHNKPFQIPEEYSAGLMSQSFWFVEFKKLVSLKQAGLPYNEIKKRAVEENLFGTAKEYRAVRMSGYLITRLKTMDDTLMGLFGASSLDTQKLINLLMILENDRLFFEFVYEVYREKVQLGAVYLERSDVNAFFTKKELPSELIAGWKESTKKHLQANYLNFMTEANLLVSDSGQKRITPPIIDTTLEQYLKAAHGEAVLRALTGVN